MNLLWDVYALTYDSGVNSLSRYKELLQEVIFKLNIKKSDIIVDSGCGTGNLEEKIVNSKIKFKKIIGFDVSGSMLKRALKKVKSDKIKLFIHDANKGFPFEDNSVDKVVMVHTLYAMQNPESILKEANRILKTGGALVVANPYDEINGVKKIREDVFLGLSAFQKTKIFILKIPVILINSLISKIAFGGKYHFIQTKEMSELLRRTGFLIPTKYEKAYADTDILFITHKK